jgi:quinol monooxygenase YgiN
MRRVIVVTGRAEVPAGNRESFLALATEMCRSSRADAGCLGYRVHADLEQPDQYVFVEEWADEESLQKHFAQPHTAAFMAGLRGLLSGNADVLFHTVASSRRLDPQRGLIDVS